MLYACQEAARAALAAGVGDRLEVVERPIQSVADDPAPLAGADVIHAGFVFHDIVQEGDIFDRVLRRCREALRPGGIMAITDSVPYASAERERRFSALFTYLHAGFMNVKLPPEEDWLARFRQAGFDQAQCVPHRFPGGRLLHRDQVGRRTTVTAPDVVNDVRRGHRHVRTDPRRATPRWAPWAPRTSAGTRPARRRSPRRRGG